MEDSAEYVFETRQSQPKERVWNLESFYEKPAFWERNFNDLLTRAKSGWSDMAQFKENSTFTPDELKNLLDAYFKHCRDIDKVYTYAHLRHDEDLSDETHKMNYQKAMSLIHDFQNATAWIEPSILQMEKGELKQVVEAPQVSEYHFFLQKLLDQKQYVLSAEKEELIALAQKAQDTPRSAFSSFNNVDLQFDAPLDSKGESHPLTHGSYRSLMINPDRTLRRNAFHSYYREFDRMQNTVCQLLSGHVQNHIFNMKARGYDSCVHAALKRNQIPVEVYHSLISTARENADVLHRYLALKKKLLGLDELHLYDTSVPLVEDVDMRFNYEDACSIVIDSVAILGKPYQEILKKGLLQDRWVDVFENKGKRSGAYSSGCYDTMPYILMNFHGKLGDLFTLSHEAGHSMNSYLSNKKQPYHKADYSIFVAEVASTFHEQLTFEYLLENAKTKKERLYLLDEQIQRMRSTFFRQVVFAEFELRLHELAEQDVPLTPGLLRELYADLNSFYMGPAVTFDDEVSLGYLRIPHFYYNFYVYQYATGIAAATYLVKEVKEHGNEKYLAFLEAGGSGYPIDILKEAGVDMASSEPIEAFISTFTDLLDRFEKEIEEN